MLQMKWHRNEQGRLCATWVKNDNLPDYRQNDQKLLEELRQVHNLYAALDAVFLATNQLSS